MGHYFNRRSVQPQRQNVRQAQEVDVIRVDGYHYSCFLIAGVLRRGVDVVFEQHGVWVVDFRRGKRDRPVCVGAAVMAALERRTGFEKHQDDLWDRYAPLQDAAGGYESVLDLSAGLQSDPAADGRSSPSSRSDASAIELQTYVADRGGMEWAAGEDTSTQFVLTAEG